ncbi:hypothetical protein [Photobacterium kishitanii]|uniref:hypothetical protein n=1 Tax=Photobacterium kishitanii TaxID=318456 RepID=UPI0011B2613D|nr:hypothetical protein [Photobacterium kishitanii]
MSYPLTTEMIELLRLYQAWQRELGYNSDHLFPLSRWNNQLIHSAKASEWVRGVLRKHGVHMILESEHDQYGLNWVLITLCVNICLIMRGIS